MGATGLKLTAFGGLRYRSINDVPRRAPEEGLAESRCVAAGGRDGRRRDGIDFFPLFLGAAEKHQVGMTFPAKKMQQSTTGSGQVFVRRREGGGLDNFCRNPFSADQPSGYCKLRGPSH